MTPMPYLRASLRSDNLFVRDLYSARSFILHAVRSARASMLFSGVEDGERARAQQARAQSWERARAHTSSMDHPEGKRTSFSASAGWSAPSRAGRKGNCNVIGV